MPEETWVPPGYRLCTNLECEAHRMPMGRPHAHLVGSDDWLATEDRRGSVGVARPEGLEPPTP